MVSPDRKELGVFNLEKGKREKFLKYLTSCFIKQRHFYEVPRERETAKRTGTKFDTILERAFFFFSFFF